MWCFLSSYLPRKPPGACQFSPWNGTVHFWATFLRSWSYEGPFNATKILQKGFATFRSFQNFLGSFQEAQITQRAEAIRYGPFQSLYGLLNQEFFLLTPVILQNCPGNFNQLICFLKGQNSKFELFKVLTAAWFTKFFNFLRSGKPPRAAITPKTLATIATVVFLL